jgi:hypothetical protein
MRKYGRDNFSVSTLQEDGNLNEDEALWISKLKPEYNMTKGGEGGDTSKSENWIEGMKNRRSYAGEGNPRYGMFGKDNSKSQQILLDGIEYVSITEARRLAKKSYKYVKENGIVLNKK